MTNQIEKIVLSLMILLLIGVFLNQLRIEDKIDKHSEYVVKKYTNLASAVLANKKDIETIKWIGLK